MAEEDLAAIRQLLTKCSADERQALFRELATRHQVHEYERIVGAPAEMILDAIHRASELSRRMLRGLIAEAAFGRFVLPTLAPRWCDVPLDANYSYDYKLEDDAGQVTIQVKLQRSEKGQPAVRKGERFGFGEKVYLCETQKTRTGVDADDEKTRPYRYGEFDILAVSMQPSTNEWSKYMYAVGRWLKEGNKQNEIATMQPVAIEPNAFWTDDFNVAAAWFRLASDKRIRIIQRPGGKRPRKQTT